MARFPTRRDEILSTRVAAAMALAIVVGFAVASPSTTAQDAEVPTHEVGDAVGFGATIDVGEVAAPYLDELRTFDETNDNFTVNELNFTGSLDIWVYMEVLEKTSAYYAIREEAAEGLRARLIADVTSTRLPAAGTYQGTIDPTFGCVPPAIPESTGTVRADIQVAYLATSSGISKWNVSDFALRESRTNDTVDLRFTSSLRNSPNVELNETACRITVTYENRDLTVTTDVDTEIRIAYSPALDYFDFPIADGETWTAASDAIVAGRIGGRIDVVGLDPDEVEEFFDALNAALAESDLTVTGLTGFPIILEDITIVVGADTYLRDGVLDDIPVPVAISLSARKTTMTLADGTFHTVYLIAAISGGFAAPCSWVYSPDDGFVVGYVCEISPGVSIFELENVPPERARQGVDDTKSGYAVFQAAGNPLTDFFLKPPFLGVLLVVAAVILVVALLVRRRRRPGTAVPPPAPPEMPPPQGP